MRSLRTAVVVGALSGALLMAAGAALADPCLVVYPNGPCTYYYDTSEYYTVGPGHALYDPLYDRGGRVLLEAGSNEIDLSIYQAPQLQGFAPSLDGEGYWFDGSEFDLVVDGFANEPTTYVNVLVVFDRAEPMGCAPAISVEGSPLAETVYQLGDLVVQTPTGTGGNYSDVLVRHVAWDNCYGLRVWAFSDPDHNGVRTGKECFTAYSHDLTVPARETTWGTFKSLYR